MRPEPPITADQTRFLSALADWSGRASADFPADAPPCGGCGHTDEDAALAKVFAEVASTAPYYVPSHSLAILTASIIVHQRRLDRAWDAARSSKPGAIADRTTWKEMRPYQAMIAVLHSWLDALWISSLERAA